MPHPVGPEPVLDTARRLQVMEWIEDINANLSDLPLRSPQSQYDLNQFGIDFRGAHAFRCDPWVGKNTPKDPLNASPGPLNQWIPSAKATARFWQGASLVWLF